MAAYLALGIFIQNAGAGLAGIVMIMIMKISMLHHFHDIILVKPRATADTSQCFRFILRDACSSVENRSAFSSSTLFFRFACSDPWL